MEEKGDYPELAAVIGSYVPDYRGLFLRHVGGNSSALGMWQEDAIREIWGWLNSIGNGFAVQSFGGCLMEGIPGWGRNYGIAKPQELGTNKYTDDFSFFASRVVPTAAENRPVNVAVKYIIHAED